jgi:hypothetical protein
VSFFSNWQVKRIYHFTPLHYMPFISRSRKLLCKTSLGQAGFNQNHFRSKSRARDIERGFSSYAHLTLSPTPRILLANKLGGGFPHFGIAVPAEAIEATTFSLCRFNVAMTRILRRNGKHGYPETSANGRYYQHLQIPVARLDGDKEAMMEKHLKRTKEIEVLVHCDLMLPPRTEILCYSSQDAEVARHVLSKTGTNWTVKFHTAGRLPAQYRTRQCRDTIH